MNIKRKVAVIGAGITLFRRRLKETGKELSYYAANMALEEAGMTLKDIESVVMGTAPDAFDGIHMKAEYLSDGAGATGRPYTRVFVGGGTGVFSPIGGWWHVASGIFDTCLVVAEEKMSPVHPHPQTAFRTIDRYAIRLVSSTRRHHWRYKIVGSHYRNWNPNYCCSDLHKK